MQKNIRLICSVFLIYSYFNANRLWESNATFPKFEILTLEQGREQTNGMEIGIKQVSLFSHTVVCSGVKAVFTWSLGV